MQWPCIGLSLTSEVLERTYEQKSPGKEMTIHSSALAWRIPGTGEPGGLLSMGLHIVGHDRSDLAAVVADEQKSKNPKKIAHCAVRFENQEP